MEFLSKQKRSHIRRARANVWDSGSRIETDSEDGGLLSQNERNVKYALGKFQIVDLFIYHLAGSFVCHVHVY